MRKAVSISLFVVGGFIACLPKGFSSLTGWTSLVLYMVGCAICLGAVSVWRTGKLFSD